MNGGYSELAEKFPLKDYQRFAVDWILKRLYVDGHEGAGLFLDPGLGKTRTTLTIADILFQLGEIKKALIVAPLRPVYTVWPKEIDTWGFGQSKIILHKQLVKAMSYDRQIEFINYEGLAKVHDLADRWDLLVLDESTYIKTWSAKRTKNVRKMVNEIPRRIILTGTPASNSLADLHAQLYVVDKGESLGKTVKAFRQNYMYQGGWNGWQWEMRDNQEKTILDAIKDRCLRMQAEDHLDMPKLVFNRIWCEMPSTCVREYKRLKRELFAELQTGDILVGTQSAAYQKCRQFANGQVYTEDPITGEKSYHVAHKEKIRAVEELHDELAGKPLLLFFTYAHDLLELKKLKRFKDCPVIAGAGVMRKVYGRPLKIDDLNGIIDKWNNGEFHAILCQWRATSHGLNMQATCNDVGCFGLPDSLDTFEQAYRRVYRQGVSGEQVRVHQFLTLNTVDEVILERLNGKHKTQTDFLGALKKHARL